MKLGVCEPFTVMSVAEAHNLAQAHDTPLFVYDEKYFIERVNQFRKIWEDYFSNGKIYLYIKPITCRGFVSWHME